MFVPRYSSTNLDLTVLWRKQIASIALCKDQIYFFMAKKIGSIPLNDKWKVLLNAIFKLYWIKTIYVTDSRMFDLIKETSLMDNFEFILDDESSKISDSWVRHTREMKFDKDALFDSSVLKKEYYDTLFSNLQLLDSEFQFLDSDTLFNDIQFLDYDTMFSSQEPLNINDLKLHLKYITLTQPSRYRFHVAISANEDVLVLCTDIAVITIPWHYGWEEKLLMILKGIRECDELFDVYVDGKELYNFLTNYMDMPKRISKRFHFKKSWNIREKCPLSRAYSFCKEYMIFWYYTGYPL